MTTPQRAIRIEEQIRVSFPDDPDVLAEVLRTLRLRGGDLKAHLIYQLGSQHVGLFVCARAKEAALSLEAAGLKPEVETVLLVQTENRWGAVSHLLRVLAEAGIRVGYSHATSATENLCVVLRTDDNGRALKALGEYLVLADAAAEAQQLG